MLSLPSQSSSASAADTGSGGVLGLLTPKRSQALIARESAVAVREADVARREAELLVGAPGGVTPSPVVCPLATTTETVHAPTQTIIKEVVKEESLTPPGWIGHRAEEILDRELRVTEREREISKREEQVNRREHDASLRESWIMEQLMYVRHFSSPPSPPAYRLSAHWAPTMHRPWRKSTSTNRPVQSEKSRYPRLSRAAPSSETKEGPRRLFSALLFTVRILHPRAVLLRPGLGDTGPFVPLVSSALRTSRLFCLWRLGCADRRDRNDQPRPT